jgi:hypothetical protein
VRGSALSTPGLSATRCARIRSLRWGTRYDVGVRIVSLLPSATEIVCSLGARDELVGRSHECDHPPDVEELPVLTSARVGPLPSSKAIDAAVRDVLKDALAIYESTSRSSARSIPT